MNFYRKLLLLSTLAVLVFGCSGKSKNKADNGLSEIPSSETRVDTDLPEAEILALGKKLYTAGLYSSAIEYFESLRSNFPLSPYIEFAEIKIADAHFESGQHEIASTKYDEFVKNHPSSSAVPYMILQSGRAFALVNTGIGRDSTPLEKSKAAYEKLLSEHPNSIYRNIAQDNLNDTLSRLAAHEQFVTTFYEKQDKIKAVESRKAEYAAIWEPILNKSSVVNNNASSTPETPTVLALNMPRDAIENQDASVAHASLAPAMLVNSNEIKLKITDSIINVECSEQSPANLTILLRKMTPEIAKLDGQSISSVSGQLTFNLNTALDPRELNCFGKSDLIIRNSGELTLASNRSATAMVLSNPERLMLILE